MPNTTETMESAAWAAAYRIATPDQLARLEADRQEWRLAVEALVAVTEQALNGLRSSTDEAASPAPDGDGRVDVLDGIHDRLLSQRDTLIRDDRGRPAPRADPVGEVRLQASWVNGRVAVWAAGPGAAPVDDDGVSDRLEAAGGPAQGWSVHESIRLPGGEKAAALSIPLADALGWLVAVGAGPGTIESQPLGSSVLWLGRVALVAVRQVACGRVAPRLWRAPSGKGRRTELAVQWVPAALDETEVSELARAMPGSVGAAGPSADGRAVALAVLASAVDAIVRRAAADIELPAPPPTTNTTTAVAEAFTTRLDGSTFEAPAAAAAGVVDRLERWGRPATGVMRTRLVVQLDPPDRSDAWLLSVLAKDGPGTLVPLERALADSRVSRRAGDEIARLERLLPVLLRPGRLRRGEVYLSQAEAWELMSETASSLDAAGFEVRVPELSRRKPSASLRVFSERSDSVVGANQLSAVRWSALFDDVELTAADIARLASEARPVVQSRGKWVELDRVDLEEAAAALAERAATTHLTGAEVLRLAVGLDGSGLAGGVVVEGESWATDLLARAESAPRQPTTRPHGFTGVLRTYQAEALGWLGFLDSTGLGGCLALDMGLGKTPTMLAHLARIDRRGKALVIAPPAVVGNWAAEAERFTPDLRVVVHHGATRASAEELEGEVADADVVITTYGTAVRDVDAIAALPWDQLVLDEAQAIKNPASDTAQRLRAIPARNRLALTGTPIENGLGDLWAILDYTNPGLVGARSTFLAQLGGEAEEALHALNGILVFRRMKTEPEVAAELPDRIDELDHCTMTPEQIGLYQAVLDRLIGDTAAGEREPKKGAILAAITALKQICNHPAAYEDDGRPLAGRSGKLTRLEELVEAVFSAGERILIFTHFAEWGLKLAAYLTETTGIPIACYHGGLARGQRDRLVTAFQEGDGPGALVLSLKAGGTGLNLTAASHVVLYDRWWNPAVEDQARDRAWRIGQTRTVISHRLVCPGTVDERVEEIVAGKRHVANLVFPKSSSLADLSSDQLRVALGLQPGVFLTDEEVS